MRRGASELGLLDLWEPGWRRNLVEQTPDRLAEVGNEEWRAAAALLGTAARESGPDEAVRRWPGCLLTALACTYCRRRAAGGSVSGRAHGFWTDWYRCCGVGKAGIPADRWEAGAVEAARSLGLAVHGGALGILERLAGMPSPSAVVPLRLDPYGGGVLRTEAAGADPVPVGPEEFADAAGGAARLSVFDESGSALTGGRLPPEPVWALFPDLPEEPLRADVELRVLIESRMPLAWTGWRLVLVDLATVGWLRFGDADGELRHVRGAAGPRLVFPRPPVAGVRGEAGEPVYPAPPEIRLPAGPSVRWRIEVRRAGDGRALTRLRVERGEAAAPFSRLPGPLLGEFAISVVPEDAATAGSVGPRGIRRTVVLAQDLEAICSPGLRLPTETGLESGEVLLDAASGITFAPLAARLPEELDRLPVRAVAGPVRARLTVGPPCLRSWIEPEPGTARPLRGRSAELARPHWRGPLLLDYADLERGGSLRFDLPAGRTWPPITVLADGIGAQVLEPTKAGRYPLRRLLDTVSGPGIAGRELRLAAEIDGRTTSLAVISAPDRGLDPWLA